VNDHFLLMVIFSVLCSLVFTYINKNGAMERLKYFLYLFASFTLLSILAALIMYPFPF
jgi:hypothetical protein